MKARGTRNWRQRLRQLSAGTLSACACVVALNGCSVAPQTSAVLNPVEIAERDAQLLAMEEFDFSGGLGIWTEQESISARISWQQGANSLQVDLSGPLGTADMQLSNAQGIATLQRGNVTLSSGPSVDHVLQQGFGLKAPIPIEQLQLWVRGLPGDAESVVRNADGKLASLRYQDADGVKWQANFKRYARIDEQAVELPSLITAKGGPYSVRLVLKNWTIAANSVVPEVQESNKRLAIPSR
jgi:outer membrane lipoprotein LolB